MKQISWSDGHASQLLAPSAGVKKPFWHAAHVDSPLYPNAHTQSLDDVALELSVVLPSGQTIGDVELTLQNVPLGHSMHSVALLRKKPALHQQSVNLVPNMIDPPLWTGHDCGVDIFNGQYLPVPQGT